ncbi:putative odorant receptor 69a [Thrips palmi]|uniref:Odorant receptor 69a n=1 Tax=Thrips palmi TaxID=161013 RepID=A0A6P8ZZH8_THRPL|nr:putative odorant receptor 69a [Thrips palmi]
MAKYDRTDVAGLLQKLGDLLAFLSMAVLYISMSKFRRNYEALLDRALPTMASLEEKATPSFAKEVNRSLNGARVQFTCTLVLQTCGICGVLIIPFATGDTFFEFWPPAKDHGLFLAKYALQVYAFLPCMLCIIMYQNAHAVSIAALEAMFRHLANFIGMIGPDLPAHLSVAKLTRLHSQVLLLAADLNRIFSYYLLTAFWAGSAIAMASALRLLVSGVDTRGAITIVVVPVGYFWVCHLGERLAKASESISEAAYFGDWLSLSVPERKMILFQMQRAHRPETVVVPFVGAMTLAFFMTTVNFWYNNVAVLRKIIRS